MDSSGIATGFSGAIDVRRFERRSRRLLGVGYLFAAAMLAILALTWHAPPRVASIAEKPDYILIGDIIERPAIPSDEPFRMRPPKFARRMGRPGVYAPEASATVPGSPSLPAWNEPVPTFEREIGREVDRLTREYADTLTVDGGILPAPKIRIPFRRETGPDPGMFKSDIIYNPSDKTAAQGYVHIPLVRFGDLKQSDTYILSLQGLTAGINRYTNITAMYDNPLPAIKFNPSNARIKEALDQRGVGVNELYVFRPPLVYILTDHAFLMNEAERESLGRYMSGGVILILESVRPGGEKLRKELRALLWNILKKSPIEPIPRDHPLYHCFFDFAGGPPEVAGQELGAVPQRVQPYLEGIIDRGRILAIFSDRGYGLCWSVEGKYEEQMKMGINLVLYSILQQREKPGHRSVYMSKSADEG